MSDIDINWVQLQVLNSDVDRAIAMRATLRLQDDEMFQKAAYAAVKGDAIEAFLLAGDTPIVSEAGADAIEQFNAAITASINSRLEGDKLNQQIDTIIEHTVEDVVLYFMGFKRSHHYNRELELVNNNRGSSDGRINEFMDKRITERLDATFQASLERLDIEELANKAVKEAEDSVKDRMHYALKRRAEESFQKEADKLVDGLLKQFVITPEDLSVPGRKKR